MTRSTVGLLAALGVLASALTGMIHGDLIWAVIASSATATGLASYLALPPSKKMPFIRTIPVGWIIPVVGMTGMASVSGVGA